MDDNRTIPDIMEDMMSDLYIFCEEFEKFKASQQGRTA